MEQETRAEKILIVDDTPLMIDMVKTVLENEGYEVIAATSGDKAIKALKLTAPDLILMDVRMPGMNGFETCRRLKREEKTKDIPVIFMTGVSTTENVVAALEAGGVDYVTKPIEIRELVARVRTHLALRRMHRQLEAQNERLQQEVTERRRAEEEIRRLNAKLKEPRIQHE